MDQPVDEELNPIPPPALEDISSITFSPGESAWQYYNLTFSPEFKFITVESFTMKNELLNLEAGERNTSQIRNREEYEEFNINPKVQTIFTTGLGDDL